MNELIEILKSIVDEDIDYEKEQALVDDHVMDSMDIIALVAELEMHFSIAIAPGEIIPSNFNSAERMWKMVQRLQEE